ncbi:hypothetical protein Tco_1185743 [Tanacetum coccineum]
MSDHTTIIAKVRPYSIDYPDKQFVTILNQGVTGLLPLKGRLLTGIDQLRSGLELAATVSLLEVLARKPDAFATLEKNIVMRFIDRSYFSGP